MKYRQIFSGSWSAFAVLTSAVSPVFASDSFSASPSTSLSASSSTSLKEKMTASVGGEKPLGAKTPGTSELLALKGARGEVLNFQLKVPGTECFTLNDGPFHPKEKNLKIRFFRMPTIAVTHPSFPGAVQGNLYDPLLPYEKSKNQKICPVPGAVSTWVWGELEIGVKTKPGNYETQINSVSGTALPLKLIVWKMVMPERFSLPAYAGMTSWSILLGHYGEWKKGEEVLNRKYSELMVRHRMIPIQNWISKPAIHGAAGEKVSASSRGLLDLKRAPNREQSFEKVILEERPKWAAFDFPTVEPDKIDAPETVAYFKAAEKSLSATGRADKAFVYLWDEPKPSEFPKLLKLAKLVRLNAPHLKIMVTTPPTEALNPYVDYYVPVMDQFDSKGFPSAKAYAELQKKGKQVWWYISCMSHGCEALEDSGRPDFSIERPAAWVRSISWISQKFSVDAFLYYSVVEGFRYYPKRDPWKSLWDFSGNGDGTLLYPGRVGEYGLKENIPVASIRLKLFRESSYDAEYIQWMEKLANPPAWWKVERAKLVDSTTKWEKDYGKYQALRDRAGEYLNIQPSK